MHVQGSSDTTEYEDLPPKVRSFIDTVQRQNMENRMLQEKIAQLTEKLNEKEQELNDKDSYGDYVGPLQELHKDHQERSTKMGEHEKATGMDAWW